MNNTTTFVLLVACLAWGAATAAAQTQPARSAFIDVNAGGQTQSRTLSTSNTSLLYGETLSIATAQNISSGPVFDLSGGYRITPSFGLGIGVSSFNRTSDAAVAASVPNPVIFNRPTLVNLTASGLKRREVGAHVMAVWFLPVTNTFDVTLSGGPSFIRVSQDIATLSVATGTQTATVATAKQTTTAKGGNVALNINYLFMRNVGIGVYARYAGGSVDLPLANGVKVGGLQLGGGIRLRF